VWSLTPFRLAFSYSTVWYVSRKKCSEYWYRKWIWTHKKPSDQPSDTYVQMDWANELTIHVR